MLTSSSTGPAPVGRGREAFSMRRSVRFLVPLFVLALFAVLARAEDPIVATGPAPAGLAKAAFAGGCFWCMQGPYDSLPGVVSATVGYAGGEKASPTYHEVSSGGTGHLESIEIVYDPKKVTYEKLLDVFWHNVDPTNPYGQFCDNGSQYRTAIFFENDEQRKAGEASKKAIQDSGVLKRPIVTEIVKAGTFWKAEDYHQSYYKKNPIRYNLYRSGCGRDAKLKELWGDAAPKH
jgi:peptide-methionine (S)-S-oxide reductase